MMMLIVAARPPDDDHAFGHDKAEYFSSVLEGALILVAAGIIGVAAVQRLDPIVALVVAANITATGVRLVRRSIAALMDSTLPAEDQRVLHTILARYGEAGVEFHALRTSQSGARRFVSLHVLVPGDWTVHRGHLLLERIEGDIRAALPGAMVLTHLESIEDPASWEDIDLDRPKAARGDA